MRRRRRSAGGAQTGFTLVEILVVVLIIGIMLTFATLSVGDRAAADTLDSEARRLEQLFLLAQEEAELKGYELGFRYTEDGYQFLAVSPQGRWLPVAEGPLRPRALPPPLQLALRVEDRPVPPAQELPPPAAVARKTAQQEGDDQPGGREEDEDDAPELRPQVLILSSGELTAFTLDVSAPGIDGGWRIAGTLLGRISLERIEADGPA